MHYRLRNWIPNLLGSGLLLGALGTQGCGHSTADEGPGGGSYSDNDVDVLKGSSKTGLLRAKDCTDLLTKIQDDAVMKVKLAVARAKERGFEDLRTRGTIPPSLGGSEFPTDDVATDGDFAAGDGDGATAGPAPQAPGSNAGEEGSGSAGNGGGGEVEDPTGASETNSQVEGVDEADFVKVVDNGKAMYLLHGNTLRKLETWPAEETALTSASLKIEGSPSEMFVTDEGKAVIFSSVSGYGRPSGELIYGGCTPTWCYPYGYAMFTKVTIADVSGDSFKAERELYYEGSYISSRRYAGDASDMVRVVLQANNTYAGLYTPEIEWADAWGRVYEDEVLEQQLDEWAERTEASIRNTELTDWLPLVQEAKNGKLVDVEPACDGYFVPQAGLSEYGLTHVLSIDAAKPDADVGGVTIMGAAQTVYSNLEHMVLAQQDYRWTENSDFGFVDEQRTALHVFALDGAKTSYTASGSVPGFLPPHNAQFGIDEQDGVVRVATGGSVRDNPKLDPEDPKFWEQHTENRVFTLEAKGEELQVIGKTESFGHTNETLQSARFVGDKAYVVTFLQTDPLLVVDVSKPEAPKVLGEVEIPGFSQYMHPLDADHLITLGNSGQWGAQLQLFDVSDPMKPAVTHTLDFGQSSSSEAQYNHKAFTFYAEESLLALPLYSYGRSTVETFGSMLRVIKVDAKAGFKELGAVDHSALYQTQTNGCVKCYDGYCDVYCYEYGYQPEVRRGHFVSSKDATYVYSFSYAGVLVNELGDLSQDLASVTLPAPAWEDYGWYAGKNDSGNASTPGSSGQTEPGFPVDQPPTDSAEGFDAGSAMVDIGTTDGGVAQD